MSKKAIIITTDSWKKLEIYQDFIETNGKFDWRFGTSKKYITRFNGFKDINIYFTHRGIVCYKARCEKIIVGEYDGSSLVPDVFRDGETKYVGHIIINRLEKIYPLSNNTFTLIKSNKELNNRLYGGGPYLVQDIDSEACNDSGVIGMTEDDNAFPEGKVKLRKHLSRERNQRLISRKKEQAKKVGRLRCCVCDFSFEKRYGKVGKDYIEAHHIVPISDLNENQKTKLEDIVLVCSNCHRMLHRKRPWLKVDQLKKLIK